MTEFFLRNDAAEQVPKKNDFEHLVVANVFGRFGSGPSLIRSSLFHRISKWTIMWEASISNKSRKCMQMQMYNVTWCNYKLAIILIFSYLFVSTMPYELDVALPFPVAAVLLEARRVTKASENPPELLPWRVLHAALQPFFGFLHKHRLQVQPQVGRTWCPGKVCYLCLTFVTFLDRSCSWEILEPGNKCDMPQWSMFRRWRQQSNAMLGTKITDPGIIIFFSFWGNLDAFRSKQIYCLNDM